MVFVIVLYSECEKLQFQETNQMHGAKCAHIE